MKDSFRQAGAVSEFYSELETIIERCQDILIWQTDDTGKRQKLKAKLVSYTGDDSQTLITMNAENFESFKKKLSIYIYDELQGILFRGKFLRYNQNLFVIKTDDNVFLREKRDEDRLYFQYTKVLVDVLYGDKLNFRELLLKDISEDGYGLLVPQSMSNAFLEGMNLGIIKLNSIEFPRPLEGRIVHRTVIDKKDDPKKTKVKLGVKFHKKSKLVQLVMKAMNE
jgi:hypothetical protein